MVAALVFAAGGAVALAGGLLERRTARAEELLMSLDFAGTTAAYDALARYAEYARYVPWIAGDALDRVRARRAAARYWDGDYDALMAVAREADAGGSDALFITANAMYRLARSRAPDDERLLRALDDARAAYVVVMRERPSPDAAFNYEYVGVVRDEIAKSRRPASSGAGKSEEPAGDTGRQTLHGRQGGAPPGPPPDDLKIYIPNEPEERKGQEPGGEQLRRRKG